MKKKMNISFSPPDISQLEIEEVVDTLKSGWITTGPKTKKLEKVFSDFFGVNKAVCVNSATAAMELCLRIMGIGPGDEVITSAYTYTASASVINHVGAKPVLVDASEDSFSLDIEALADVINERTKAIIPVDIAGVPCDYDRIYQIVEDKKDLFVANNEIQEKLGRPVIISDSAHSIGATYKGRRTGSLADFSCFSLHAVKNITTAEGGVITWRNDLGFDDQELYRNFQLLSLHGQSKDALAKSEGGWEYDILIPGYKYNMTDINASLGLAQMERIGELYKRRKEIVKAYDQAFAGTRVKAIRHEGENYVSSRHLYLTNIEGIGEEERSEIISKLKDRGIATNVHYKPLPMMTAYKEMGFDIKDYPKAFSHYKNEISLPLHTLLTDEEVEYIIESLKEEIDSL